MFVAECHSCSRSILSSIHNGAVISRLLLMSLICTWLTVPALVIVGILPYSHFSAWVIVAAECFNTIHATVYMSIVSVKHRSIKRRLDAEDVDPEKHNHNGYEPAYLSLFTIHHLIVAYIDALLWTAALATSLTAYPDEISKLDYEYNPGYFREPNEERLTLLVYLHLFLLVGAGLSWAAAILATVVKRRRDVSGSIASSAA